VTLIALAATLAFMISHSEIVDHSGAGSQSLFGPSDEKITQSGVFGALVPLGGKTNAIENQALAAALSKYEEAANAHDVAPIVGFVERYPNSAWNASLLLNLGITYRNTGHFSLTGLPGKRPGRNRGN
jgi:hypothetical protein